VSGVDSQVKIVSAETGAEVPHHRPRNIHS
jgi:hypothetical protein